MLVNQLTKIFEGHELRIVDLDGEPWFVAKDVCNILELTNPTKAMSRLDEDERSNFKLGRQGEVNIVNEFGLYSLVMGSRKSEAKQFKRWITHDVLPSIRRTGSYSAAVPKTFAEALRLAAEAEEEKERLLLENAQKEQIINELQPKASYYDLILQNKSLLSVSKIAKDYGMSAKSMNKLLNELGIQYKQGNCWLIYAKYQKEGYTQSKEHVIDSTKSAYHTYWTQKGRLFIYETLKNRKGLLPLIEREG
ncbi:phage antirepressor [Shouchella clausii]|uniref:phage antirepressor n=1 Tax=Shouchella clausii TaxID=79880 RepID=UPI004067E596